jgi:hypothetical protein
MLVFALPRHDCLRCCFTPAPRQEHFGKRLELEIKALVDVIPAGCRWRQGSCSSVRCDYPQIHRDVHKADLNLVLVNLDRHHDLFMYFNLLSERKRNSAGTFQISLWMMMI